MSRFSFYLVYFHLFGVLSLYEDQVGKFDWRKQYVGQVRKLYWETERSATGGKRLYVCTDRSVIAAINTSDGDLAWRKVFEEGRRGDVDDLVYTGTSLLSVLAGTRLQAWNPAAGSLVWETAMEGDITHVGKVGYIAEPSGPGIAVGLSSTHLYGANMRDGSVLWNVELPNSDVVKYDILQVVDSVMYVIGRTSGTEVKVISVDKEGATVSSRSVLAGFLRRDTRCSVVEQMYLMCVCPASESLQVLSLQHGSVFTATSIQDLGVREGPVKVLESTPAGTVLLAPGRSVVLVSVAANNKVTVKKHLPKALVATAVQLEDKWYLMYLQASSNEELKVGGIELETGSTLSELSHTFHYPRHSGQPELMSVILARKKDGKLGYRMAVLSQDFSLQLIHKTGKVAWRREESLAYTYAVELLDLPVSENQAKFEEEFGSHADNVVTMFMKRVKTQVSQLQTFLLEHLHRLQGVKQTSGVIAEEEEEDEEDLLRDEFSLHKMMVMITEPGKIIGMRSQNGHIVWQHLVPDLAPFDTLGSKRFLLFVQRTTAHFPHQPQCVVLGKNRVSGRGQLFAFNPITGEPVSGMPGEGEHLPYSVRQAFLLGVWDEHFMKPLVMMDHSNMVQVYPASMLGFLRDQTPHVYMYQADTDNSMLYGYRLATSGATVTVDNVWTVNLQNQRLNMKITNIVGKPANEHVHSQGRVLGDRTVLYKYLNPNVVVVTTEGEEPATQQLKAYPIFNVYMIDVVTGHMLFHGHHRKAVGPIHVVHSENWVVYAYYNQKQLRHEMAALELYEGKEQSNMTAFSSLTAPTEPLVLRQAYVFPLPIFTMATSITEKGITSKDILIALKNGGIFSLPKAFMDPRRPLVPTQETQEEGTVPYIPELPVHTEGIINYYQTLSHIRGLHTSPTGLESTSLVLAYGLDLFQTQVQPSKMFDVLKEDFEHWLIASVVLAMLVASFITQKLAARKALSRQWM
ncbi:ER membrane protein complex subunit 1-like isoform X1 [Dreissena polymorpha]|uniref:ER membrane protein complex subunit 1-like isoform X1 n=2 Tax=Dreissena polymorpha TaxID=45954 RepID=UPI002263EDFC|nr:ER membrane protein complex subunit 1-like isoform X1 [Dreissena polymorpha]